MRAFTRSTWLTRLGLVVTTTLGAGAEDNTLRVLDGVITNLTEPLIVGDQGTNNRLVVSGGTKLSLDRSVIGRGERAGHNLAWVADPGTSWETSALAVGAGGADNGLVVTNGATLLRFESVIGGEVGEAFLTITGPGSAWINRTQSTVGYRGRNCALSVTGGGFGHVDWLQVGVSDVSLFQNAIYPGTAVSLGGGGASWRSGALSIRSGTTSNAFELSTGGTLVVTNAAGDALLCVDGAILRLGGGTALADRLVVTNMFVDLGRTIRPSVDLQTGLLSARDVWVAHRFPNQSLTVGDGTGSMTLDLRGGSLLAKDGVSVSSNARFQGAGLLYSGSSNRVLVSSAGTLRPVASGTALRIEGDLLTRGSVEFVLSGPAAGTDFGTLEVTNRADLSGRLEVGLGTGYRPAWTNQYVVMRWRSREGAFTNAPPGSRLSVGAGSFRVVYAADALVLADYVEDLDSDRVDDLWAQSYFGHSPLTLAELAIDSDGDGSSNAAEYLAGTDPGDGGSVLGARSVVVDEAGVRLRFSAVLGRGYRVWYATALPDWTEVVDPVFAEPGPGELEWVDDGSQTGQPPGGVGARFYRLGVE